ncbi:2-dehydropantoate 2-reductase [Oceanimonas baumannii]|uniref:ketopantoate reductase family protein n=1 Tax=Oceanimonas baumannii TaxID=129578 RepID=UPI001D1895B6|nr:2-dehydropantoate 2-reductase [Oceanimonas baumannii]MCC4265030.1 2-dehydropantoate 2-reductase [Oceanimonas baumannii]
MMREWTILGAGALGCTFAALLNEQQRPVSLILSERHRRHFNPAFEFIALNERRRLVSPHYRFADQAAATECLLVMTKAYQVLPALKNLHNLPRHVPVILLHNGMGVAAQVTDLLPHNPLLAGVTSHGALREGPWQIRHTGKGETWLGPLNEQGKAFSHLLAPLSAALGHAEWSEDILSLQHRKLAINAVINPLTACHHIRNGQLAEPRFADVLTQLCEEVHSVLSRLGETDTPEQYQRRLNSVIELTATNYSSMHQDLAHGRPTEIDYITGYLLKHAGDLPVPVCQQLYNEVKKLGG